MILSGCNNQTEDDNENNTPTEETKNDKPEIVNGITLTS